MSEMTLTVFEAIETYIEERQIPPSLQELCGLTGLQSTSNIRYHLVKLEDMGMIKRVPRVARGIVVLTQMKTREQRRRNETLDSRKSN